MAEQSRESLLVLSSLAGGALVTLFLSVYASNYTSSQRNKSEEEGWKNKQPKSYKDALISSIQSKLLFLPRGLTIQGHSSIEKKQLDVTDNHAQSTVREDLAQDCDNEKRIGPPLDDARYGGLTFLGDVDNIYDDENQGGDKMDPSRAGWDSHATKDVSEKQTEEAELSKLRGPKPFCFNQDVARVFDDMVSRSVPLYREVNDYMLYWIHKYYKKSTVIIDLGCSTGTTLDLICKSFNHESCKGTQLTLLGVDNSEAMVEKCQQKLSWLDKTAHSVKVVSADLTEFDLDNVQFEQAEGNRKKSTSPSTKKASFVIMNYTLQFLPVHTRHSLLKRIWSWLIPGGVLFISEKIGTEDVELQETTTYIYEDFKARRGYTKSYIARKKEALMNVLVPHTEDGLKKLLREAGFRQVNLAVKWNNFATFTARKPARSAAHASKRDQSRKRLLAVRSMKEPVVYKYLDQLFEYQPEYLYTQLGLDPNALMKLIKYRQEMFKKKANLGSSNLDYLNRVAKKILHLDEYLELETSGIDRFDTIDLEVDNSRGLLGSDDQNNSSVAEKECKGSESGVGETADEKLIVLCKKRDLYEENASEGFKAIYGLINDLIPWKKGPVKICDIIVDAEWRSDMKWSRLVPWLPSFANKTICDIGCNNGYFMFQMMNAKLGAAAPPKLVIGIEPSLNCLLQFQFMKSLCRYRHKDRLKFEFGKGDMLKFMPRCFDITFCLGVLYHTSDPIQMLKDIHSSLKPGGYLFVDCQGIVLTEDSEEALPLCLFPRKRYANMKGVYFLPTIEALKNWLQRASFTDVRVVFNEKLSTKEQRITPFAPVNTSLKESLHPEEDGKTVEGYPAPYRFYLRAKRG